MPQSISTACSTTGISISAPSLLTQRQPGRHRQRVADLVEPVVALAPDQLAGVEGDDDQHEGGEAARDQAEHLEGHRPGAGAEDVADGGAGEDQEQQPGEHEHAEVDVLGGLAELEPDPVRQEPPGGHRPRRRGGGGPDRERRPDGSGRRVVGRVGDDLAACGRAGPAPPRRTRSARTQRATMTAPMPSQSSRFHSSTPSSGTSRLLRSEIVQYSVRTLTARAAERVDQRRQGPVVGIAHQLLRDQPADQHQHAADVDRQHLLRRRGEAEEDRADHQRVRQQHARGRATR